MLIRENVVKKTSRPNNGITAGSYAWVKTLNMAYEWSLCYQRGAKMIFSFNFGVKAGGIRGEPRSHFSEIKR